MLCKLCNREIRDKTIIKPLALHEAIITIDVCKECQATKCLKHKKILNSYTDNTKTCAICIREASEYYQNDIRSFLEQLIKTQRSEYQKLRQQASRIYGMREENPVLSVTRIIIMWTLRKEGVVSPEILRNRLESALKKNSVADLIPPP